MRQLAKATIGIGVGAYLASRWMRHARKIDLRGRVVAITGGSRGLGLALAERFLDLGARVAICGRDPDTLARARELAREHSQRDLHVFECDVADQRQASDFVTHVQSQLGPIDVLVNNAGRIEVGPLDATTKADFQKAMATHFWGPYHTIMAVLTQMKQRRFGRIVNISSIGGKLGAPHLVPYDASKFALSGLSEAITAELRQDGIRVTTVYPGLMRTGSPRNANFKGQNEKEYSWFAISDAAPLLTIGARRAAAKIVDSCLAGDATLVLTPAAKLGVIAHDLAPGLVIAVLSIVNRLLPDNGGIFQSAAKGRDSETPVTRSPLTALNRSVEQELNQA